MAMLTTEEQANLIARVKAGQATAQDIEHIWALFRDLNEIVQGAKMLADQGLAALKRGNWGECNHVLERLQHIQ